MEEILTGYFEYLKQGKHLSQNTLQSYQNDLKQYLAYVQSKEITNWSMVTRKIILDFLVYLQERNRAQASLMRMLSSIKRFHLYLQIEQITQQNPTLQIELPKKTIKEPEYLTFEEIERIMQVPNCQTLLGLRDRVMLELLYASGVRVSEFVELKVSEFNLVMGLLHLTGKSNRERIIPLAPSTVKWLQKYLKQVRGQLVKEQTPYMFVNHRGKPFTRQGVWKIIKQIILEAKIEKSVTPQTFRHSLAVHLLQNGADLATVQEILGHVDISTTEIYVKMTKKRLSETYLKYFPRA